MNLFDSLSGLVNAITGTGTRRDKAMAVTWRFERASDTNLVTMYRSNWLAAKIVNIPVDDMLREGWTWQADADDMTKLEAEERRLGLRSKLHQVLIRDALYGGGALIAGDGSGDPSLPLNPESIGLGGLKYLLATGRGELTVSKLVDSLSEEYGQPEMYELNSIGGKSVKIHPSRVFAFNGQPISTPNGILQPDDWWGDSRLSAVERDIAAASAGITGVGRLMDELAVAYHKIAGLTERLSEQGGAEAVQKFLNLVSTMKSSLNAAAIDAEDEVEIITASFAGIPDTLKSLLQNISGAADIPLTRFLGSSPDGMNATGESDTRNYYDRLAGRRAHYIEPSINRLDELLIRSALGKNNDKIYRVWNPLWQMNAPERIEHDAARIKALGELRLNELAPDHVLEQVTRNILIDSPIFTGAETAYDEADKMPDPTPEEVEAANALQAQAVAVTGQPPKAPATLRVVGQDGKPIDLTPEALAELAALNDAEDKPDDV